jgi:tetratricopeptide (TPR) repeat protein
MRKRRNILLVSFIAFAFAVHAQQGAPSNAIQFQNQAASLLLNGKYHEAIDALKISASFYKEAQQWPHYFSCLNQITNAYLSLEDYDEAKTMAKEALWSSISNLGKNNNEAAKAAHQLAEVYSQAGRYEDAAHFHEMALKIRKAIFNPPNPGIADSYRQMGKNLSRAGQFQEAEDYYQQARSILEQLFGEESEAVADIDTHLGQLYEKQYDISRAIPYHQNALNIYQALFGEDDVKAAPSLWLLSQLYQTQKQDKEALAYMEKAANIFLATEGEAGIIAAEGLFSYSSYLMEQGNYQEAFPFAQKASTLFMQNGRKKIAASAHVHYGQLLLARYQIQEAIPVLKRAALAHTPPSSVYRYLSIALAETAKLEEAIYYANQYEKAQASPAQQAAAKLLKVALLVQNNQIQQADEIISQAIPNISSDILLKEAYLWKAKILFYKKDYQAALSYCDKASAMAESLSIAKGQLLQVEALIFEAASTFSLSQQGNNKIQYLTAAHTGFQEAYTALNQLLVRPLSNQALVHTNQLSNQLIAYALDCSYELFQQTQEAAILRTAFSFIEKGKATDLAIRFRVQEPFLSDWASLNTARWNVAGTEAMIEQAYMEGIAIDEYEALLSNYKEAFGTILEELSSRHPSVYQLGYAPEIIDSETLQATLGQQNQAALSYYVSKKALYVVAAKADHLELFRHEITPRLDQRIKQFYLLCSSSPDKMPADELAASFTTYKELSQKLYPILNPLGQNIHEDPRLNPSIVFFPHGPLHLFPFDALNTGSSNASNYGDVAYLGRLAKTNYHYSASTYLQSPDFTPLQSFIGIFPEGDDSSQLSIAKPISRTDGYSDKLLSYLLPLANRMAGQFGGSIFTNSAQLDIANDKDQASFFLLGFPFRAPLPLFSIDNYESRKEIGWLNLFAPLGKSNDADIFMFPSNAISELEAGANCGLHLALLSKDHQLLMNRNVAEEKSTSYFIDAITAQLFKDISPSEALLSTRLSYLKQQSNQPLYAHPYYWSGYCYIGKHFDEHENNEAGTPYWIFAIIGVLIAISLWLKRS